MAHATLADRLGQLLQGVGIELAARLIGVFVGLGSAALIARFGTPIEYSATPVVLAFGCAFLTGLIFGFLPARKASRLDPVVALASE